MERNIKIQALPRILNGIKVASYSQISEILKINKGEVESYIIEAIQNGLLKAKIDEFQETILITYYWIDLDSFDSELWEEKIVHHYKKIYQQLQIAYRRLPPFNDVLYFQEIERIKRILSVPFWKILPLNWRNIYISHNFSIPVPSSR